jgi:DNA repair exonuclease SbcCD nuclease subunit
VAAIQPFRFLHTGDLHLDSPFAGLIADAPAHVSAALRDATLGAWDRIVALALDERVDFVVVAGDAFEHANRTLLAQVRFRDGLARLGAAGIGSFVVTGNHDPLSGWEPTVQWPASMHRFDADAVGAVPVLRDGVEIARVYGISYAVRDVTDNLALRFRREPDAPYAIGLLHANVGGQPGHQAYAPCTVSDLRATGIDYWALGHVHKPAILSPTRPTIVYCGNPQGRDPGEAEPRGCWVVDVVASGVANPRFVPVDAVRWCLLALSIEGIESEDALVERAAAVVATARDDAGRPIVAQVTLTGRGPLHESLARAGVLADVQRLATERIGTPDGARWAWIASIRNATLPAVDLATAGAPGTFLGELLAQAEAAREAFSDGPGDDADPTIDERMAATLEWEEVLDELYGHHRARRLLAASRPDPERMAELLTEAERMAVDCLLEAG